MDLINTILITLGTLAVLVAVHEYGHFWVARRCGVKVLRFSIGFGTSLYTWKDKLGTEYSVAAIPLGGYVRMLDEREGEVPQEELEQAFNRKPVLQRIAVVSAGPLANLVLAVIGLLGLKIGLSSGLFAPPLDYPRLDRLVVLGAPEGSQLLDGVGRLLSVLFSLNLILFTFNLIPIPPISIHRHDGKFFKLTIKSMFLIRPVMHRSRS